jgi:threonine dehydrogenase-like Zn-dependent dehydrogenase
MLQGPYTLAAENNGDPKAGQPGRAVTRITTTDICGPDRAIYQGQVPPAGERARIWIAGAGRGSAGA